MNEKPPDRFGGCVCLVAGGIFALVGGSFLAVMLLGRAGVIQVQGNGPEWPFYLAGGVALLLGGLLVRYGWRNLTRPAPAAPPPDPAVREAGRAVLPVVIGFVVVGLLSVAGAFAAVAVFNAPMWVVPVVFFAPPVVFVLLTRSTLTSLAARLARAVPSPERRAAVPAAARQQMPLPGSPVPTSMEGDWPTVPAVETRPGRVRTHALRPTELHPACGFGCCVLLAVLWNGFVGAVAAPAVRQLLAGKVPDAWWTLLFLIPFVLAGLGLIGLAALAGYRWLVGLLVGRVEVEVSGHPLAPGGRYDLYIAQRGAVPLGEVTAELVCAEEATYTAGTSKSTATGVVGRHPAGGPGGLPLEAECEVPAGAMHSFKSPNNAVVWTVQVRGRALGALPYSETFAVAVRPESLPPPVPAPAAPAPTADQAAQPAGSAVRVALAAAAYRPGDEVTGVFVIPGGPPADTESVELSVLWHTSGKGTEDLGVVHYRAWTAADGTLAALPNPCTFSARLPRTPWTYDGELVKVHWAARVRVRYGQSGEALHEVPFTVSPGGGS